MWNFNNEENRIAPTDKWSKQFIRLVENGHSERALASITKDKYERGLRLGEYYWFDNPELADRIYNKLTEVEEKRWESWHNRGLILSALERYDVALECLEVAVQKNPLSPGALCEMGRAQIHREEFVKAKQLFEQARKIDPEFVARFINEQLELNGGVHLQRLD